MATESRRTIHVDLGGLIGTIWFIGWLFTMAFASLDLLHSLFGLAIWPYYLGLALR